VGRRLGGVGVCAVYVEVERVCDGVNRAVGWVTGCLELAKSVGEPTCLYSRHRPNRYCFYNISAGIVQKRMIR